MNLFRGDRQIRRSSLETSEKDGADTTDNLQSKWDILQNIILDQIQFISRLFSKIEFIFIYICSFQNIRGMSFN